MIISEPWDYLLSHKFEELNNEYIDFKANLRIKARGKGKFLFGNFTDSQE